MTPRVQSAAWAIGLGAIVLAGLLWRLHLARVSEQVPDEAILTALAGQVGERGAPWPLHGGDHPALGIYLLASSARIFGRSLVGYRLLNVFLGSATILALAHAVARSGSRPEAVAAAFLLAANPFHAWLSSLAAEVAPELLFVTAAAGCLACVATRPRAALVGSAACLGLAFMCNESAALVGLGWAIVFWRRPELRAGLDRTDYGWALAAGLTMVAPDVVYNLTATRSDFHYVNYLDHFSRMAHPTVSLQGLGFFLRDAFNVVLTDAPPRWLWVDLRDEYVGPGVALGAVLLAGWIHSFRRDGDPTGGLWGVPTLLFLLVTTFTRPAGPFELDPPNWTWPATTLTLVTAAAGRMVVLHWRRAWPLLLALVFLMFRRDLGVPLPGS